LWVKNILMEMLLWTQVLLLFMVKNKDDKLA
jgi:hypothetical protein